MLISACILAITQASLLERSSVVAGVKKCSSAFMVSTEHEKPSVCDDIDKH